MHIETVELTLSQVGLGDLRENSAMTLFGVAQAHALTSGTPGTLRTVVDSAGNVLYPGYYWTHLQVPAARRLETFELWTRLEIGVDVRSFGGMVLDSTYALGSEGELDHNSSTWRRETLPMMRAGSVFVVDGAKGEPQPAVPTAGSLAELPRLEVPPQAATRFSKIQSQGAKGWSELPAKMTCTQPIVFPILTGRDVAVGRALMFARIIELMDCAEAQLLTRQVRPGFPTGLVDCLTVLERETFYLGNCYAGDTVEVVVRGTMRSCQRDLCQSDTLASAASLEFVTEMYQQDKNTLLAVAKATKLLTIPTSRKTSLRDAERLLASHGG